MTPVNAASFGKVGWFIGLTVGCLVDLFVSLLGFDGWLVGRVVGWSICYWLVRWLVKHDET